MLFYVLERIRSDGDGNEKLLIAISTQILVFRCREIYVVTVGTLNGPDKKFKIPGFSFFFELPYNAEENYVGKKPLRYLQRSIYK